MAGVKLNQTTETSVMLLGIHIQSNLKWSEQISYLASKLQARLSSLEKLRYVLTRRNRVMIVEGVFNSVLCYCLPVFGGCGQSQIDELQTVQNRAARLALRCPPRSHRDWMFDNLKWLTVVQLIA